MRERERNTKLLYERERDRELSEGYATEQLIHTLSSRIKNWLNSLPLSLSLFYKFHFPCNVHYRQPISYIAPSEIWNVFEILGSLLFYSKVWLILQITGLGRADGECKSFLFQNKPTLGTNLRVFSPFSPPHPPTLLSLSLLHFSIIHTFNTNWKKSRRPLQKSYNRKFRFINDWDNTGHKSTLRLEQNLLGTKKPFNINMVLFVLPVSCGTQRMIWECMLYLLSGSRELIVIFFHLCGGSVATSQFILPPKSINFLVDFCSELMNISR